jgi:hypothetical protein
VVQRLPAASQRQELFAQVDERGQSSVQVAVLVEEMATLCAEAAKPAAEHILAEHQVRAARPTAAVEALFGPIVDARDAHRGQLHGQRVKGQVSELAVATEAVFSAAFANLIWANSRITSPNIRNSQSGPVPFIGGVP